MKNSACAVLLFICSIGQLNAQNASQHKAEKATRRELIKDLHTTPLGADFKGAVILDGRLLEKGLKSISFMPVDTIRTVTYITPQNVTRSLLDNEPDCKYGILVLSTSTDSTILPINFSYIENIILNSKVPPYKNISNEPL